MSDELIRLNLGCGTNPLEGWVNIDRVPGLEIDFTFDLDNCKERPLPYPDNSVDIILLSHVMEHLNRPLDLMEELYRVAKPEAKLTIRVPHGASDDAFEDPTHVTAFFPGSFGYYSQPYYWRADYNYRGDWLTGCIILHVNKEDIKDLTIPEIMNKINKERNVVIEMEAELYPVKPMRQPLKELQLIPQLIISKR